MFISTAITIYRILETATNLERVNKHWGENQFIKQRKKISFFIVYCFCETLQSNNYFKAFLQVLVYNTL
jgi:hypothetical protein